MLFCRVELVDLTARAGGLVVLNLIRTMSFLLFTFCGTANRACARKV